MDWNQVLQLLSLLLTVIAAIGGSVKIVELLKALLGAEGFWAQLLAWTINGLIAVVEAMVAGQIAPGMEWVEILTLVVLLFLGQHQLYQVHKREKLAKG